MSWADMIMVILEKIMFAVILNILWILGVIMGGVIFGVAPATLSLSKVLNDKTFFENNSKIKPIVISFFKNYKNNFLKANLFLGLYGILFYLLIIDYNILKETEILYSFLQIPLLVIALYVLGTFIFAVPIATVSKGGFKQKCKLLLVTPILMPLVNILNIIIVIAVSVLMMFYPLGTILIFVVAGIAAISFISISALRKKELVV